MTLNYILASLDLIGLFYVWLLDPSNVQDGP
jgi:hypothetical protein